jgi:hypothetical protein
VLALPAGLEFLGSMVPRNSPAAVTTPSAQALQAMSCWHCLQGPSFFRNGAQKLAGILRAAVSGRSSIAKENAEMSEMSEIPRAVRLRRDRSIAMALAESAERLSRAKPRGLSYSSVASLRRIKGTVRSCQA